MTQQNDQAYLIDINNVVYELVAEESHELHDMNGHIMASDPEDNLSEEIGRALAEEHVKPHTLTVCGPNGHPQQAWNIMRELQEDAVPCAECGKTPQFVDTMSGAPELGFRCEEVTEDIEPEAYVTHELYLAGETALRFEFRSDITRLEWPEKGSTNLTQTPYPGDAAATVEWLIGELTARGNVSPDREVTNPDDRTQFTDDTLREYLQHEREEWINFPRLIEIIEIGPSFYDDEDDDEPSTP